MERLSATTTAVDPSSTKARLAELSAAVQRLGLRRQRIDSRQMLWLGGAVLLPLGVLVVFSGWYGAAHSPYLFEQLPYLISGGLIGLALVITGGFLYFGHLVVKVADEGRENRQLLERIATTLEHMDMVTVPATVSRDNSDDRLPGRARRGASAGKSGG